MSTHSWKASHRKLVAQSLFRQKQNIYSDILIISSSVYSQLNFDIKCESSEQICVLLLTIIFDIGLIFDNMKEEVPDLIYIRPIIH